MALPPIHRIDHTPCLILADDTAWDQERIKREFAEIDAAAGDPVKAAACQWAAPEDHPIYRYNSGASRFDLRTVEQYLIPGEEPVRITLRRLDDNGPWQQVLHLQEMGKHVASVRYAMRAGIVEITGADVKIAGTTLDDAEVARVRSIVSDVGLRVIGGAVINVSREIFDAEKKR